jgi:hypothetical protein
MHGNGMALVDFGMRQCCERTQPNKQPTQHSAVNGHNDSFFFMRHAHGQHATGYSNNVVAAPGIVA